MADPDKRISILAADKAVMPNNEFFDESEEGSGLGGATLRSGKSASRDIQSHKDQSKRARTNEDLSKTKDLNHKDNVKNDKVCQNYNTCQVCLN